MTPRTYRILWLIWLGILIVLISFRLLPWWFLIVPVAWILRFEWLAYTSDSELDHTPVSQDLSHRMVTIPEWVGRAHHPAEDADAGAQQQRENPPDPTIQLILNDYAFRATKRGLEWADIDEADNEKAWKPVRQGSPPSLGPDEKEEIQTLLSKISNAD